MAETHDDHEQDARTKLGIFQRVGHNDGSVTAAQTGDVQGGLHIDVETTTKNDLTDKLRNAAIAAGILLVAVVFALTQLKGPSSTPSAGPSPAGANAVAGIVIPGASSGTTAVQVTFSVPPTAAPTELPAVVLPTPTPTCAYATEGRFLGLSTELKLGCAKPDAGERTICWQAFVNGHAFWRVGAPGKIYGFDKVSKNVSVYDDTYNKTPEAYQAQCSANITKFELKGGIGHAWCDDASAQDFLGQPAGELDCHAEWVQEFDNGWISEVRIPKNATIGCSEVTKKWAIR